MQPNREIIHTTDSYHILSVITELKDFSRLLALKIVSTANSLWSIIFSAVFVREMH